MQLPDGYASNEFISLDYIALDESFATLGFSRGDRWGVLFADGAGGTQAIIFHAVPEPSTLGLALVAWLALPVRRWSASVTLGCHGHCHCSGLSSSSKKNDFELSSELESA